MVWQQKKPDFQISYFNKNNNNKSSDLVKMEVKEVIQRKWQIEEGQVEFGYAVKGIKEQFVDKGEGE